MSPCEYLACLFLSFLVLFILSAIHTDYHMAGAHDFAKFHVESPGKVKLPPKRTWLHPHSSGNTQVMLEGTNGFKVVFSYIFEKISTFNVQVHLPLLQ